MILIERQKNIIDFMLSSFKRRKGKTLALLSVYSLAVFMLASVVFISHAIRKEASFLLRSAPELVIQRVIAGRHHPMPVSYLDKIKNLKGIDSARARLWGYYYDPIIGANYTLVVPEDFDQGRGNIAIGEGVSRTRLAFEGDTMEFRDYEGGLFSLTVTRILPPGTERVSSDLILVSQDDFRSLLGMPKDFVTDLTVRTRNQKNLSQVGDEITALLPDSKLIGRDDMVNAYGTAFTWRGGIMMVVLTGGLFALIILAWDKASGMGEEERREVGILKAMGWPISDILLMKFWEGLGISLSCFLLGTTLAYVHVFLISSALFEPVLKGWAALYPDFRLIPFIDLGQILALFLATVFPYTVATILPALRVLRIDLDLVMRT
ncbi:MAG: ABC transporter permease [Deltaproteobacteria bacterium RBG_16_49_23]|nr:MAG: ABC transporter permease [Deltaproteobacteria bacterium RBG_16_49_23]